MRWLKRVLSRDGGATLVIVAISIVVLIGFVGLAVDGGVLFSERRELSRGADAAALAIAEDCAKGLPCDDDTAWATAEIYADANADDGSAAIETVDLDLDAGTVHVRTKSWDSNDGTDTLKFIFMPVLGISSTTVHADATAQWGVAAGGSSSPLIISGCEWDKFGYEVGTEYQAGVTIELTFHQGGSATDCNAQAGQDTDGDGKLPGGFGWLETFGDCIAEVDDDAWADEEPGNSPPNGCSASEFRELVFGKTVVVPVFDDTDGIEGNGANGRYLVHGLAAFHVTAYNFGGQYREPSKAKCPSGGGTACLLGYFTGNYVMYDGQLGSGGTPDYGVYIVKLIG